MSVLEKYRREKYLVEEVDMYNSMYIKNAYLSPDGRNLVRTLLAELETISPRRIGRNWSELEEYLRKTDR